MTHIALDVAVAAGRQREELGGLRRGVEARDVINDNIIVIRGGEDDGHVRRRIDEVLEGGGT